MSDVTHEEIMGGLGLLPWEEHRAAVLARDAYGTQHERRTGRTTWACIEALRACMRGDVDVVVHVPGGVKLLLVDAASRLVNMARRLGLPCLLHSGRVRISGVEVYVVLYDASAADSGPMPYEEMRVGPLAVRITDRSMDRDARVGA